MKRPRCSRRIVRGLAEMAATFPLAAPGKQRADDRRAREWIRRMVEWYAAKGEGSKAVKDHNEQG
ncbi:MAG: hypothetical protein IT436_05250 [Phycisphaerales bacterium]|nr:hypothetical protein [Phycisphaerales bacterium]